MLILKSSDDTIISLIDGGFSIGILRQAPLGNILVSSGVGDDSVKEGKRVYQFPLSRPEQRSVFGSGK
jgi:hypothetical protein